MENMSLSPAQELACLKSVVARLMADAEKVLAEVVLINGQSEIETKLDLLARDLDHARRLCKSPGQAKGPPSPISPN